MLTQERLHSLLDYDQSTGIFTHKSTRRRVKAGSVAGTPHHNGYIVIGVDGQLYGAHRLAWLFVHGSFPINHIDHKNGIKTDNSLNNLRDVTISQNQRNSYKHRAGRLVGTTFIQTDRWKAQIAINGKSTHLGLFATELLAHIAFKAAESKLLAGVN